LSPRTGQALRLQQQQYNQQLSAAQQRYNQQVTQNPAGVPIYRQQLQQQGKALQQQLTNSSRGLRQLAPGQ